MRTYHTEEGFSSLVEKAHKSTVWSGRHLPQNRYLHCIIVYCTAPLIFLVERLDSEIFVTGGGNGTLNLYK
jgi:hypothetical protein